MPSRNPAAYAGNNRSTASSAGLLFRLSTINDTYGIVRVVVGGELLIRMSFRSLRRSRSEGLKLLRHACTGMAVATKAHHAGFVSQAYKQL